MIPIFVGGCVRSGTTMLGAILGKADRSIVWPENYIKNALISTTDLDIGATLEAIRSHFKFYHLGISDEELDILLREKEYEFASLTGKLWRIVTKYARIEGNDQPLDFLVDHMPSNIYTAPLLLKHYPKAKFIHIIRDGRAVANSVMKLDWGPNDPIEAADLWIRSVGQGLAAQITIPSEQFITVSYEDLVTNPEREVQKICQFTGQRFDSSMLEGTSTFIHSYTQKQHKLVGKRPQGNRLQAWKKELGAKDIKIFEKRAYWMLTNLGYGDLSISANGGSSDLDISMKDKFQYFFLGKMKSHGVNKVRWRKRPTSK